MKEKILLALDDYSIYEILEKRFNQLGISLIFVVDGIGAIEECLHAKMILISGDLPHISGFEAAELIKRDNPLVPIICLSSSEIPNEYKEYFIAHFPHPIDYDTLIELTLKTCSEGSIIFFIKKLPRFCWSFFYIILKYFHYPGKKKKIICQSYRKPIERKKRTDEPFVINPLIRIIP